jgi:hypothetical protein
MCVGLWVPYIGKQDRSVKVADASPLSKTSNVADDPASKTFGSRCSASHDKTSSTQHQTLYTRVLLKNTADQLLISREIQNRFLVWFQFQTNFSAISVINCSTRGINISAGNTHPRFGCLGLCVRNLHRLDLVRKALWRLIEEFTNGNWLGWRRRV